MLIQILVENKTAAEFRTASPVVVGRQSLAKNEPAPFQLLPSVGIEPARLIIAPFQDEGCSRRALKLDPLGRTRASISNLSKTSLHIQTDSETTERVEAGSHIDFEFPFDIPFSTCTVRVMVEDEWDQLETLALVPGEQPRLSELPALSAGQLEDLTRWMQTTAFVFQSTLSTNDFIPAAAAALVEIVGLDSGRVLLLRDGFWVEAARQSLPGNVLPPSQTVLDRVRAEKRTFWKKDELESGATAVLSQLSMVVAAPILDAGGEVVGVLYGERRIMRAAKARLIGKPEALLVEMLACGIATGLARQKQQDKAVAAEMRFAQFFTRELAEQLVRDPSLLEGREANVSLLFADVRGFSRISERIGAAATVQWIGDVMDELFREVLATTGVVMDLIGDEMVVMWGAPTHQPDHAVRAVQAGLAMLEAMPRVSARWSQRMGEPSLIGIGVNSGLALVGNTGSQVKFRYGALGNTVNLASRAQGLTKYFKRPFLVTAGTRDQLGSEFISRRICRTRVVNIAKPVDLYEVEKRELPAREEFFAASEAALDALEKGRFAEAARMAGTLLGTHKGDGPLQLILLRAAASLINDGTEFNPIWDPPGK